MGRVISADDGALLNLNGDRAQISELSPEQTTRRLLRILKEDHRYERLLKVAHTEPPRVRAILGALGETLRKNPSDLRKLRVSLNPISRFDFGMLSVLPAAEHWQAARARH